MNATNPPTSREIWEAADLKLDGMTDRQCRDALAFLIGLTLNDRLVQLRIARAIAHGRKQEAK